MREISYPFEGVPAPGETMEVAPGVRWLRMQLPMALDHINLYLLESAEGWWVIDTGMGTKDTHANWERIFADRLEGKPIRAVLCTHMHPDHIGMAGMICKRWKAPLYMTANEYINGRMFAETFKELDAGGDPDSRRHILRFFHRAGLGAEFAPSAPSEPRDNRSRSAFAGGYRMVEPMPRFYRRIRAGQTLEIGGRKWRVMCGGGHSPEHASLYCEEAGVLFSGDQVLPRITSNVSVSPMEPEGNPLRDWLGGLPQFAELPDDTLVMPAHNAPFYGVRKRISDLQKHHEEHMRVLRDACAEPQNAKQLLPLLFKRKLDPMQTFMATGECLAHLHLLMERGEITRTRSQEGVNLFQSAPR